MTLSDFDDADVTQAELREMFNYNPETGQFIRRKKSGNSPAGSVCGGPTKNGYWSISVRGKKRLAHRMAWLYVHGELPPNDVDHRDGNRQHNAIDNLRPATRAQNMQNLQEAPKSNKSTGLLGCSLHKASGRFMAYIRIDGKRKYLGLFDTAMEAHQAHLAKKREAHPFNML